MAHSVTRRASTAALLDTTETPKTPSGADPEKRKRILDAAIRTFGRRGFHEARIAEIAAAAGVAEGTVYLYFKNKEDLLGVVQRIEMLEDMAGEHAVDRPVLQRKRDAVRDDEFDVGFPDLVARVGDLVRGDIHGGDLAELFGQLVGHPAGAAADLVEVPGALEIAPAIGMAFRMADYDGFVALGPTERLHEGTSVLVGD